MTPASMTFKGPEGDVVIEGEFSYSHPYARYERWKFSNITMQMSPPSTFPTGAEALADFERMGGKLHQKG